MTALEIQGEAAKKASRVLAVTSTETKDKALKAIAQAISDKRDRWLAANAIDMENARKDGMRESLQDRLLLNDARVDGIVKSIEEIIALQDPIGEVMETVERPNGLHIEKRRVPLGVIGIIYEARPNVTADAIGLCLKSGNAVILKGGREAIHSNTKIADVLRKAAEQSGIPIEWIEGAGHNSNTDAPERANEIIENFLATRE